MNTDVEKEDSLLAKLEDDFCFMSQQTFNALELVNSFKSKPARSQHIRQLLSQKPSTTVTHTRPWSFSRHDMNNVSSFMHTQAPITVNPQQLLKNSVAKPIYEQNSAPKPMVTKKIQASSPLCAKSKLNSNESSTPGGANSARSNYMHSNVTRNLQTQANTVISTHKQELSSLTPVKTVIQPTNKQTTSQKPVTYFPPAPSNTNIVKPTYTFTAIPQPMGTTANLQSSNHSIAKPFVHNKPSKSRGVTKSLTGNTTTLLASKNFKSFSQLPAVSRLMQPTVASTAKATSNSRIIIRPDPKDQNTSNISGVSAKPAPPHNNAERFKANISAHKVHSQPTKINFNTLLNTSDNTAGNISTSSLKPPSATHTLDDEGTVTTPIRSLSTVAEVDKSLTPSIDFANFSNFSYVADWAQTPLLVKRALMQQNVNTERLFGAIPAVDIEATFGLERRKQQQEQQTKR